MALRIPVQKDIGEYEEKIVGKMSLRTLACVSLGFGSAVGAAAFVHLGLRADVADAAFPIMLCSMPFWLAGFWRPFGMRAEELLPLYLQQGFALRAIRPLDSLAPCFWLQADCLGQNVPPVWVPMTDRVHLAILLAKGYAALESRESPQGTVLALYPV